MTLIRSVYDPRDGAFEDLSLSAAYFSRVLRLEMFTPLPRISRPTLGTPRDALDSAKSTSPESYGEVAFVSKDRDVIGSLCDL